MKKIFWGCNFFLPIKTKDKETDKSRCLKGAASFFLQG
jgi:hypothetical protein